jgi:FixJ family two-component response regulator
MTLAVVDDDDDVRTALSRLLAAMGHDVKVFTSAEDFESQTVAIDCVILDMRLPGLTGLELRERLRHRATSIPVVLITGDGDSLGRDTPRVMDTPLITKPFDADILTAAIDAAITSTTTDQNKHAQ